MAWITTTDHKKLGIMYCVTAFTFFLVGGALAGAIRAELADTGSQLVGPQTYNTLFTVHGITMIFLFVAPFGIGLANYLVPFHRRSRHGVPPAQRDRGTGSSPAAACS